MMRPYFTRTLQAELTCTGALSPSGHPDICPNGGDQLLVNSWLDEGTDASQLLLRIPAISLRKSAVLRSLQAGMSVSSIGINFPMRRAGWKDFTCQLPEAVP